MWIRRDYWSTGNRPGVTGGAILDYGWHGWAGVRAGACGVVWYGMRAGACGAAPAVPRGTSPASVGQGRLGRGEKAPKML